MSTPTDDTMAAAALAGARVLRDTINAPNQSARAKLVFDAMNAVIDGSPT